MLGINYQLNKIIIVKLPVALGFMSGQSKWLIYGNFTEKFKFKIKKLRKIILISHFFKIRNLKLVSST